MTNNWFSISPEANSVEYHRPLFILAVHIYPLSNDNFILFDISTGREYHTTSEQCRRRHLVSCPHGNGYRHLQYSVGLVYYSVGGRTVNVNITYEIRSQCLQRCGS